MVCLGVMLSSAILLADDRSVLFDPDINFSAFKTFAAPDGAIASRRPEFNNPVAIRNLTSAIRGALVAKGLKEGSAPDLIVLYRVTSVDFDVNPWARIGALHEARRTGRPPAETPRTDVTDATLEVHLLSGDPPSIIWRGVYNDTEKSAKTLAESLPRHATRLLADYPPGKKK
jgi:hypothetical protein